MSARRRRRLRFSSFIGLLPSGRLTLRRRLHASGRAGIGANRGFHSPQDARLRLLKRILKGASSYRLTGDRWPGGDGLSGGPGRRGFARRPGRRCRGDGLALCGTRQKGSTGKSCAGKQYIRDKAAAVALLLTHCRPGLLEALICTSLSGRQSVGRAPPAVWRSSTVGNTIFWGVATGSGSWKNDSVGEDDGLAAFERRPSAWPVAERARKAAPVRAAPANSILPRKRRRFRLSSVILLSSRRLRFEGRAARFLWLDNTIGLGRSNIASDAAGNEGLARCRFGGQGRPARARGLDGRSGGW